MNCEKIDSKTFDEIKEHRQTYTIKQLKAEKSVLQERIAEINALIDEAKNLGCVE